MKQYLKVIFVGLILLTLGDFLVGKTARYLYFNQKNGIYEKATFSIEETTADILIFGSSRANHHYDTRIIEDSTKLSAFNTGRNGHFIFYQTALLKPILNRYSPKSIILDFSGTFEYNQQDYDRLSSLLPYFRSHKELRDVVLLKSPYERYKLASEVYPFNSTISAVLAANLLESGGKTMYNGYTPATGVFKGEVKEKIDLHYTVDPNKYRVFEEFLTMAKEKQIPTIVVFSPLVYERDMDYSVEICKELCRKHKISFYDFSKDSDFLNNRKLFKDQSHLNQLGAETFTKKLVPYIPR